MRWCKKFNWYERIDLQEESSKNQTDLIPMLYFITLHTTVNRMKDKIDHCVAGYGLWQLMLYALQPSCSDSRRTLRMTWWWIRLLYCAVTKGSTGNYRDKSLNIAACKPLTGVLHMISCHINPMYSGGVGFITFLENVKRSTLLFRVLTSQITKLQCQKA